MAQILCLSTDFRVLNEGVKVMNRRTSLDNMPGIIGVLAG